MKSDQTIECNIIQVDTKKNLPWKILVDGKDISAEIMSISVNANSCSCAEVILGYNTKSSIKISVGGKEL